jgi:predicted membrane protein
MADPPAPVRRIPLKISGVIGFVSAALYLAVIVGAEDRSGFPQAYLWLAIMTFAGVLAWFADRVEGKERRMAFGATALFFFLAMFSSPIFVLVYLAATFLAVFGWLGVKTADEGAPVES